ncbi:uncharacterized protein FOMMEDRAFT_132228 [Fomitiporia mediterranea MF3/22]|uniref:uncharacterized protein n=1 Tax=Fomitiporia mediterranea (strain MF3/22) TaxID=694068 RepID=UPI0004408AF3|nr:uncharacterized protein FOMMEDRAFT_132228 [Fomitiporia mediterranea MF3/22]EJD05782.1 hypothetical protein FOMMEDRAFT_132228 [Fomitiporia mediterranea MF3/22]
MRFLRGSYIPDASSFSFYPHFFDETEQKVLLSGCLKKLDSLESQRARRRRNSQLSALKQPGRLAVNICDLFRPDCAYEFQEGHFDDVINGYRETHVRSWPSEDYPALDPLLNRLKDLLPDVKMQTHILHLSTEGQIFPHVDNLDASGSWILGVSLGAPRVLRLMKNDDESIFFDVLLPSGSVYIQRDLLRFEYKHSILKDERFGGDIPTGGQRVSIMIRDMKRES